MWARLWWGSLVASLVAGSLLPLASHWWRQELLWAFLLSLSLQENLWVLAKRWSRSPLIHSPRERERVGALVATALLGLFSLKPLLARGWVMTEALAIAVAIHALSFATLLTGWYYSRFVLEGSDPGVGAG